MKIPFQCLQVCGDILFAARGGNLHTLRVDDGAPVAIWKHPAAEKEAKADSQSKEEATASAVPDSPATDRGRPAKRARLDEPAEEDQKEANGESPAQRDRDSTKESKDKGEKKQYRQHGPISRPPDRAVINVLAATADRSHVVAVTGNDKTIWVFEHDGAGHVKQLSQRTMPKRPCSIVITPDGKTILSADKFGDVYSLPLLPSDDPPQPDARVRQSSTPAPSQQFKPQANPLTVHTKGNLRALEAQQRQLQKQALTQAKSEAPTFEHTLLLGHVSLLTCVALGSHEGRQYIITADRDEHIRVSRGVPQAHVIEAFCLGHEEFVSALCIPAQYPDLLISGGGDADLFTWRWREGKLLSRTPLLSHVRDVVPETSKVAVSGLYSCWERGLDSTAEPTCTIVVICERVPAVFCFVLGADGSLRYSRRISVLGNPLAIQTLDTSDIASKAILAIDTNTPENGGIGSLQLLDWGSDRTAELKPFSEQDLDDSEVDITSDELAGLLYTNEHLRKQDHDGEDAVETEQ